MLVEHMRSLCELHTVARSETSDVKAVISVVDIAVGQLTLTCSLDDSSDG